MGTTTAKKTAAAKKTAEPTQSAAPQETQEQKEARLKREAYSAAVTRLKNEHLTEFRGLVVEEAQQRGVVYTFQKSKEEKALEQVEALLREHPEIRDQLMAKPATVSDLPPAERPLSYEAGQPLNPEDDDESDEG